MLKLNLYYLIVALQYFYSDSKFNLMIVLYPSGNVPAPIIVCSILDGACLLSKEGPLTCDGNPQDIQNCWISNSRKLSIGLTLVLVVVNGVLSVRMMLAPLNAHSKFAHIAQTLLCKMCLAVCLL